MKCACSMGAAAHLKTVIFGIDALHVKVENLLTARQSTSLWPVCPMGQRRIPSEWFLRNQAMGIGRNGDFQMKNFLMPRSPSPRPVFLNLMKIQMPVGALTSIVHRVTGVLLAASIPLSVYLLDRSLQSEQAFAEVLRWLHHWAFKGFAVMAAWALAHHLLAGIRHLLMDIDVGSTLRMARRSAWGVNAGGFLVALLTAAGLS